MRRRSPRAGSQRARAAPRARARRLARARSSQASIAARHSGSFMLTTSILRSPGGVLLVACYELGHQPLSLASPLATLRAADFAPHAIDTSVETLDDDTLRAARLIAISVPMHTALRLGAAVAERARRANPD